MTGEQGTLIGLGGESRFIETASSHGKDGDSQRRIGSALRTLRAQVLLETKVECLQTLEAVVRDVQGFDPLPAPQVASIADRAQVLRSTGFWLPADRGAGSGV